MPQIIDDQIYDIFIGDKEDPIIRMLEKLNITYSWIPSGRDDTDTLRLSPANDENNPYVYLEFKHTNEGWIITDFEDI